MSAVDALDASETGAFAKKGPSSVVKSPEAAVRFRLSELRNSVSLPVLAITPKNMRVSPAAPV
jgi:hypothetical protein